MKNKLLKRLVTVATTVAVTICIVLNISTIVKANQTPLYPDCKCGASEYEGQPGDCVFKETPKYQSDYQCSWECTTHLFNVIDFYHNGVACPYCGYTPAPTHQHDYTGAHWSKNDTQHWKECVLTDCPDKEGSKTDAENHDWSSWNATTGTRSCQKCSIKETCSHDGATSGTCSTCGKNLNKPTPKPTPEKKTEKKLESKYIAPKEENPAFTHPDREKLKSILPHKSVIALNGALYDDLKVFAANDTTKANQALLVNNFAQTAGKKARILVSDSLYTSRMLGGDNGKTRTLKWVNLEKNPQIVYACCYNQTDKAYFIQGILDKDGTATFNDFILRDMTNITIFVLE